METPECSWGAPRGHSSQHPEATWQGDSVRPSGPEGGLAQVRKAAKSGSPSHQLGLRV